MHVATALAIATMLLHATLSPAFAQSYPPDWETALRTANVERLGALARSAGTDGLPRDRYGITPLHRAASSGCVACVQALLDAGIPAGVRRRDGGTPLHVARPAVRPLLIAAGADVGARDALGRIPLAVVADPDDSLLAPGIDTPDHSGFTALHWAALAGAEDKLRWLLARGADPTRRSTAPFDHYEGVLAAEWDPAIPFAAGQRPVDLAEFMHDRTKWSTQRYWRTWELLDAATPSRAREALRALFGR